MTSPTSAPTVRLTTAQALVRWLQAQYSERDGKVQRAVPALFGIFGHGNVLGVAQAVEQEGAELPLFQPKNEQAMVHAAIGYAKASRRLQTLACSASIGPGASNMLTGAGTATTNRLPVLLLPSDTFANRRQGPVLQQLEHPVDADLTVNDCFRPLSRFFDRIARPEQLLTALPQALRVLLDPAETGAVTISLHQDVQGEAFDWPLHFFERRMWSVTRRPAAASELAAAAELLRGAQRPLVIAGGGVRYSEAEQALLRFARELRIPVAETSAGKGSLAGGEWLVGGVGVNGTRAANELARDADVVVNVGTRLSDFTTGSHSLFQHPEVRFLAINVNAADAHKLSAAPVVADAREALDALRAELAGHTTPSGYAQVVADAVRSWERDFAADLAPRDGEPLGQGEVLSVLNDHVQEGDWVVAAAGWQPGDLLKLWRTPPGSFTHIEFAFSCMGHEIPAGLGIRMREGAAGEVFVVIGDGTYLMSPTELVTAVQEGLKLTVLVLDNGGYQSISRLARGATGTTVGNEFRRRGADGRLPDGEPLQVDFVANARSMGCEAVQASTRAELEQALAAARAGDRSTVIVCPTAPLRSLLGSGAFWDLGVPEVADSPETQALTAAHRAAQAAQRHY
ncbi:MAG TPA: 3D-(3,5/4)-trihydroxycyclohexane-1,2-dione acylhydrolase (decyclizing) [Conexibacter sp.]